jgi:hypothetical protein
MEVFIKYMEGRPFILSSGQLACYGIWDDQGQITYFHNEAYLPLIRAWFGHGLLPHGLYLHSDENIFDSDIFRKIDQYLTLMAIGALIYNDNGQLVITISSNIDFKQYAAYIGNTRQEYYSLVIRILAWRHSAFKYKLKEVHIGQVATNGNFIMTIISEPFCR